MSNADGNIGGKSFQDREKAAKVRHKLLDDIYDVLDSDDEEAQERISKWSPMKMKLVDKMANNVLPRLNEVTGADGEPLIVKFDNSFNATSPKTKGSST